MCGKPLTELTLKALKPKEKVYSLSDGNGLIIEVRPSGSRYWIIRYWVDGKEKRKSLGTYPEVSLRDARESNRVFRQQPPATETPATETFGAIAEEWFTHHSPRLDPGYAEMVRTRLEKYILPNISNTPINEVSSALVLSVCREVEATGAYELAHRTRQIIGQVCRYAIMTGKAENDPTTALKGALHPAKNAHHATITDRDGIGGLIRSIEAYGGVIVRLALKFSALTFCRPGEIRRAEWSEIEGDLWKIPAEKMKMRRGHIVPLSRQSLAVLLELRPLTGRGRYLFPSAQYPVHR